MGEGSGERRRLVPLCGVRVHLIHREVFRYVLEHQLVFVEPKVRRCQDATEARQEAESKAGLQKKTPPVILDI
jgi:hypothetical protein